MTFAPMTFGRIGTEAERREFARLYVIYSGDAYRAARETFGIMSGRTGDMEFASRYWPHDAEVKKMMAEYRATETLESMCPFNERMRVVADVIMNRFISPVVRMQAIDKYNEMTGHKPMANSNGGSNTFINAQQTIVQRMIVAPALPGAWEQKLIEQQDKLRADARASVDATDD